MLSALLLAGCAAGPRPVPPQADAAERLVLTENVLTYARGLTATYEIDSTGENASHFTGTLELVAGNALHLTGEGTFRGEAVQLDLDSRDPDGTNRSATKGASVSSHRDPPAPRLREVIAVSLARLGLLHSLATLAADKPLEKLEGGLTESLQPVDPKDGKSESIHGEPCRRADYAVRKDGAVVAETSVCISNATALPLQRNITVHFPQGDMVATETYKWQVK